MPLTVARRGLVLLTSTAALVALLALTLPVVLATPPAGPTRFEDLLVRGCALTCAVAAAWWWLGSAVLTVTAHRARPTTVLGVPRWWRRAVLAGCGVALVGAAGSPALAAGSGADPGPGSLAGRDGAARVVLVPGLPLPQVPHVADRPSRPPPTGTDTTLDPGADPAVSTAAGPGPVVVVAPGDSLWAIAARRLGEGATDAQVDRAWRALYARNAAHLGPDPDLIRPGQRLTPPTDTQP